MQKKVINIVKMIPNDLKPLIHFKQSNVISSDFRGIDCHYYEKILNIVPDFIYLDAPHPNSVKNNKNLVEKNGITLIKL